MVGTALIREIDLPAGGGLGADLVIVTGTGAWHQLTSWRCGFTANPMQIGNTPPIDGHHPQVHLLSPPAIAGAPKLLTGRIAGATFEEPALIDLVKVPTTDAIADFFTVTQVGDSLELEIWRSGQE